jgi:uncharacterized membrane protein
MSKFFKSQLTFLLYGLVFWLPVAILLYILFLVFNNAEGIGKSILGVALPDTVIRPGFGIILFVVIVYISGFLLKSTKVGGILSKIPLLGLFFGQGEVITISRLLNMQPCLFLYSPTCTSYGWILSQEKVQIGEQKAGFTLISVYYPNVPTLVTGSVFAIRKDTIMKLGNSSREVIDLLLYAFRSPPYIKFIKWEDESQLEFETRSKSFGLKENNLPVLLAADTVNSHPKTSP